MNNVGLSRKHIIEGLDAALERLNLTYVDLVVSISNKFNAHIFYNDCVTNPTCNSTRTVPTETLRLKRLFELSTI